LGNEIAVGKLPMEIHDWAVGEYFIQLLPHGIKIKEARKNSSTL
jgi:hypothetical protein